MQKPPPEANDMASVGSLREHLVQELNDLINAEEQLIEALPLMAPRHKEEKAADEELTQSAEDQVIRRAAEEWHEQRGMLQQGAEWVGSAVGTVARRAMPRSSAADRQPSKGRRSRSKQQRARR